jgi:hypothetical protein
LKDKELKWKRKENLVEVEKENLVEVEKENLVASSKFTRKLYFDPYIFQFHFFCPLGFQNFKSDLELYIFLFFSI